MNSKISMVTEKLLRGMGINVQFEDCMYRVLPSVQDNGDSIVYLYRTGDIDFSVKAVSSDDGVVLYADMKSLKSLKNEAVTFDFDIEFADKVLTYFHDKPFWMFGGYPKANSELENGIQGLLLEKESVNYGFVFLVGDVFFTEGDKNGLHLRLGSDGYNAFSGPVLSMSASDGAIESVRKAFENAHGCGAITVPLRKDRKYPDLFEDFGWCTWNTFYQDVTADKIYAKLDEFRSKNVKLRWMIIDDGWSKVNDKGRLVSFEAEPSKFPDGLKECVRRIKEDYGVQYVGVWHSFASYWSGISEELANEYAPFVDRTVKGWIIPGTDEFRSYVYWNAWHSYLAECGVDFVKVDNQSSLREQYEGSGSYVKAARATHEGLERSVRKNFSGRIINCMGMDMVDELTRPYSAVSRNSDDFFPDVPNGFAKHVKQNVYSAIWQSQVHYCDYDMWWSGKSAPVQSGVLRAISGGPVYVSDAQGDTDRSYIYPVAGNDGSLCRLEDAAMPTDDCIYCDPEKEKKLLKIFNRAGENYALAVYNISLCGIKERFSFNVIPDIDTSKEYVAYEYFTKKFINVDFENGVELDTSSDFVACYSIYPVKEEDGKKYIELGDTDRYVSINTPVKNKYYI